MSSTNPTPTPIGAAAPSPQAPQSLSRAGNQNTAPSFAEAIKRRRQTEPWLADRPYSVFKNPLREQLRTFRQKKMRHVLAHFINQKLKPRPEPPVTANEAIVAMLKKRGIIVEMKTNQAKWLTKPAQNLKDNTWEVVRDAMKRKEVVVRWIEGKEPKPKVMVGTENEQMNADGMTSAPADDKTQNITEAKATAENRVEPLPVLDDWRETLTNTSKFLSTTFILGFHANGC